MANFSALRSMTYLLYVTFKECKIYGYAEENGKMAQKKIIMICGKCHFSNEEMSPVKYALHFIHFFQFHAGNARKRVNNGISCM